MFVRVRRGLWHFLNCPGTPSLGLAREATWITNRKPTVTDTARLLAGTPGAPQAGVAWTVLAAGPSRPGYTEQSTSGAVLGSRKPTYPTPKNDVKTRSKPTYPTLFETRGVIYPTWRKNVTLGGIAAQNCWLVVAPGIPSEPQSVRAERLLRRLERTCLDKHITGHPAQF